MSPEDVQYVLDRVKHREPVAFATMEAALEYIADQWARVTELNREIASLNAGLTARIEEVRDLKEALEELKRERPVEVPDEDEHVCPRCDKQGVRTVDECPCCTPAAARQDEGGCYTCGYKPCLCDQQ